MHFAWLGPIDAHAANGELGQRDMVQQRLWRGEREVMQTVGSVTSQENKTAHFVVAMGRSGVWGSAVAVSHIRVTVTVTVVTTNLVEEMTRQ